MFFLPSRQEERNGKVRSTFGQLHKMDIFCCQHFLVKEPKKIIAPMENEAIHCN